MIQVHTCKCHKPHVALYTCKNNDTKYTTDMHTRITWGIGPGSTVLYAVMAIIITVTRHCPIWHAFSSPSPLFLRITPYVLLPPFSDLCHCIPKLLWKGKQWTCSSNWKTGSPQSTNFWWKVKLCNVKIPHLTWKYNLIIPDHVQLTGTALTS